MMNMPDELVIASHNAGKVREINELIQPLGMAAISASELDLPEPEENGDTFEANAAIKSESAAVLSGKWSLADDSGLCVPTLNDDPGIYSARWAGASKDFTIAMEKVREALMVAEVEPEGTAAYFVCVLALSAPGSDTLFFRGEVHGTLTFPPRGSKGFGYDPIFVPTGHSETFAEFEPEQKHAISHRARAFALFLEHLHTVAA